MTYIVYPYKMGSGSSKVLATALNARRVYPDRKYVKREDHFVINWGSTTCPIWDDGAKVLNDWDRVTVSHNKYDALVAMGGAGVRVPEYTTEYTQAKRWNEEGCALIARTLLRASGGRGTYHISGDEDVLTHIEGSRVRLWSKYIPKLHEYRIHVGYMPDYTVRTLIQHKRKVRDAENCNYKIRNTEGGWIFAINDIVPPNENVVQEAIHAVYALGLDFGAVDVIWNEGRQRPYVLEVNTAPGLAGTTTTKFYTDYIEEYRNAL